MRTRSLALFSLLAACGGKVDAPTTDAATSDTGASDTAVSDSAPPDATPLACVDDKNQMPLSLKTCGGDGECSQSLRMTDCCGSMLAVGVHKDFAAAFGECERERQKGLPLCDCIPKPLAAEDGSPIPADGAASVRCELGYCRTYL